MACAPRLDWRGRAAVLARSHMNSMITFERTTKTSYAFPTTNKTVQG